MLTVNDKGELKKTGSCLQKKCVVSLIATDLESGKSLRLTVKMSPAKVTQKAQSSEKLPIKLDVEAFNEDFVETQESPILDEKGGEPGIANIQFSPLSASEINSESQLKLSSIGNERLYIRRLVFEEQSLQLVSGEKYTPTIVAIDNLGKKHLNHGLNYECAVENKFSSTITVLAGCVLVAVEPGETQITLQILNSSASQVELNTLNVQVEPKRINTPIEGFTTALNISEFNLQNWIRVAGLNSGSYYRVELSGGVSAGHRLSVFTRSQFQYQTCINTIPRNYQSVACYFQAGEEAVTFVVENPLQVFAEARLSVASVSDSLLQKLLLNTLVIDETTAVSLMLNEPVSRFIFANEAGGNNRHFYVFESESQFKTKNLVKLSFGPATLKLSVNWAGGYCNPGMFVVSKNDVSCVVPSHVAGRIFISIDGNNEEFGSLKGVAAASGGENYRIVVSEVE